MTPTITLPRATVEQALEALRHVVRQAQENLVPTIHYGPVNDVINRLEAALAQQAEPVASRGWLFRRNADGTIGIFAPPPKPGESQRTSDCVGPNNRDLHELLGKLADHMAALTQQTEPVEPVATVTECEACFTPDVCQLRGTCDYYTASQMRIAAPQQQAEPLTVERLRDALVASRIIPPAAVEEPDEYDDGVTLFRIEALHRRIT